MKSWYPLRSQLRYWNGHKWTDHVAGVTTPDPPAHSASATGSPHAAAGRIGTAGLFGWGGLALLVLGDLLRGSGISGAAATVALFALVVGGVVLIRGRVGWAHLHTTADRFSGRLATLRWVARTGYTVSDMYSDHPVEGQTGAGARRGLVIEQHYVVGTGSPEPFNGQRDSLWAAS